ncbi:MAG TPA: DGQHR domain-containing protein [Steroidobacteraceae bacterium]|nr:DGQHR domain-containing protein [Steroidobacteraceae bacterium]
MQEPKFESLTCICGMSAQRQVLVGFAAASVLRRVSYADVLDEDAGRGYQRRFNSAHSLDFRKYIQAEGATTIPLTFNLRPRDDGAWRIRESGNQVFLEIRDGVRALTQVDCQHRLGHLTDLNIELPFMCFVGLRESEEMQIFNVINSKAKGLSPSLLDFHDAQLCEDLASERPELYISIFLKNDPESPWAQQLDLGGTSGKKRRASLRTMQKAVRLFLKKSNVLDQHSVEEAARVVLDFWSAVSVVLPRQWSEPRKHWLNKGVGVYALMEIASDLVKEAKAGTQCDCKYFSAALSDFATDFDWSTNGPLKGLGGEGGATEAVSILRDVRRRKRIKVVSNG